MGRKATQGREGGHFGYQGIIIYTGKPLAIVGYSHGPSTWLSGTVWGTVWGFEMEDDRMDIWRISKDKFEQPSQTQPTQITTPFEWDSQYVSYAGIEASNTEFS
jgi:hypothetical protein